MTSSQSLTFNQDVLQEIIRRVIDVAKPEEIILFGSAVRDEMGSDSDVDLLVVVEDGTHRRKTSQAIYRSLVGVGFATDLIVVTKSDLELYQNEPSLIVASALEEGKRVYAKQS